MAGGEAQKLFCIPHKATKIQSLGKGRFLVIALWVPEFSNPDEADYQVFEQLPFMANGQGFVGQRRTGPGIYDTNDSTFRRITPPHMDVAHAVINHEETQLLITATDYVDVKPQLNHVYLFDFATEELTCLSEGLEFGFRYAGWRSSEVIVTGCDQKQGGVNQNVQFFQLKDRHLTCLTPELDSSLHNCVGCDCRYGLADQTGVFFPQGDDLIFCATEGFRSHLFRLKRDGTIEQISHISSVDNFDVLDDDIAFVGLKDSQLQELFLHENAVDRQVTDFNGEILADFSLSEPEYVQVDNGEGWLLDGWVMKPIGFEEGKKYPTILTIHGGPKAAYGDVFFHEMQCLTAKGYVVIYTNPRGSDGRGSEFSDIRGRYGVTDYHDLMAFTDWCVAHVPCIDETRLGVVGGSYGGYMVHWMVTHTHRFKAAVSQRPISNWVSKFGSCDIGYYYVQDQHVSCPWESIEQPWEDSPLKHAAFAKTPLLIIQSSEDFRCEASQSFQMFTAMKVLGVPCRLVYFNGENHELSRSGKPRNRLARLREIENWFDSHL